MKDRIKKIFISCLYKAILILTPIKKFQFNSILIFVPHPDDEILGLGGYILQFLQQVGKVHLVYLTDGEGSGIWHHLDEIKRQRITLSEKACEKICLKSSDVTRLHLPDGQIPHSEQTGFSVAVSKVRLLIEELKPDAVFATHPLDYWPYDHVACAEIAREAVGQSVHKPQLFYYWVWAWYNLRPWQLFKLNYRNLSRVDIRKQLPGKKELTKMYMNTLTPDGKPWSGVLPKALLKALEQPFEVVEKIEV